MGLDANSSKEALLAALQVAEARIAALEVLAGQRCLGAGFADPRQRLATRQGEALFREIFERSPLAIALLDAENRLVLANQAYCRLLQLPEEAIYGLRLDDITHPDDLSENLRLQAQLQRNDIPFYQLEKRYLRKDGEALGMVMASRLQGADAEAPLYLEQVLDLTQRKQMEEALRESGLMWRNILVHAPQLGVRLTPAGKIVFANKHFLSVTGWDEEGVLGRDWFELCIPEHEQARVRQVFTEVMRAGEILGHAHYENEILTKSRERLTVAWFNVLSRDLRGGIQSVTCLGVDLTERKRAEEALRVRESLLRGLFDNMPSGAAIYEVRDQGASGADYIVKDFNATSLRLESKAKEEVLGKSLLELRPNIDEYGLVEVLQRVWRSGVPETLPSRLYVDQHFSSWYENRIFRLPGGEIVAIYDDVSERMRTQEALREVLLQLEATVKAGKVGLWDWDIETERVFYSREWKRQIGYEEYEIGDGFEEWQGRVHPEDLPGALVLVREAIDQARDSFELEFRFRHKDGSWRWILALGSVITDVRGRAVRAMGAHIDITERKVMERALRESEQRYREVVNSIQETLSVFTADGEFLFVNDRAARNMSGGGTPQDVVGRFIGDLLPLEEAQQLVQRFREVIAGQEPQVWEVRVSLPDGPRWFQNKLLPIRYGPEGRPCVLSMSLDITERKRIEDALRESEAFIRAVMDNLPLGIAVNSVDPAVRFSYMNDKFPALYRTTREALADDDMFWSAVYEDPEFREQIRQRVLADCASGDPARMVWEDVPLTRKGEETRYVSARNIPVPEKNLAISTVWDVTEYRRLVEALQHTTARLEEAQRVAQVSDWEWLPGRDEVSWSAQMYEIFGLDPALPPPNYAGQLALYPPEDAVRLHAAVTRTLEEGVPFELELGRVLPDGTRRSLLVRGVADRDTRGAVTRLYGSVQDITELQRTRDALVAAKEAAEAANRSKSEFLANMSHEIRTPLNGILGMLQLLTMTELSQEQKEYALAAIQSSRRLTRLLSDILDLSRVEAGKLLIQFEPLDLRDALHAVEQLFRPVARQQGLELRFYVDPAIPGQLLGDAARLQQVLTNLVGNALKFTEQGSVTVEAYPLPHAAPGQYRVLFSVADTGRGIPDNSLDSLFKPFSQVDQGYTRRYQGAGLGLSISRHLVSLMGGTMAVSSQLGQGSTFHFCIVFALPQAAAPEIGGSEAPGEPQAQACRVLLAEDDAVNRLATARQLEKCGCVVTAVADGQQAVEALGAADFDVVLMDVQMPVLDGVAATRAIRGGKAGEDKAQVPIVALTAYAMGGDRERFLAAGLDDYLAKPTELADLQQVLARVMTGWRR